VHIAKVDCTVEKDICTQHDIKGYPTLIALQGDSETKYNGAREAAALKAFVTTL
jgi:protein disulfide-isomerase A1